MEKIKNFLKNKWVKLVSWGLVVLGSSSLIVSGVTAETIGSGVALTFGIITAVGALIAFINGQIKK